jgi:hypothetical protein
MRRIWVAAVALAAVWAAVWALGRIIIAAGLTGAPQATQGALHIARSDISGFPLRFDIALAGVAYSHAQISAAVPTAHISAPIYAPLHLNARLPALTLNNRSGPAAFLSGDLSMNIHLRPWAGLPLHSLEVEGADLALGWGAQRAAIAALHADLRTTPDGANITLTAQGLALPLRVDMHGSALVLGDVQLDGDVHFDGAFTLLSARPARALIVRSLTASTPAGQISMTASLAPDSAGLVSGSAQISLSDVVGAVRALKAGNIITPQTADALLRAANANAAHTDAKLAATLPLRLQFGQIWLGFIPLGTAPDWPL